MTKESNWIKVNQITFKLKSMGTGFSRSAAASRMKDPSVPAADEMTLAGPKVNEDREQSV